MAPTAPGNECPRTGWTGHGDQQDPTHALAKWARALGPNESPLCLYICIDIGVKDLPLRCRLSLGACRMGLGCAGRIIPSPSSEVAVLGWSSFVEFYGVSPHAQESADRFCGARCTHLSSTTLIQTYRFSKTSHPHVPVSGNYSQLRRHLV